MVLGFREWGTLWAEGKAVRSLRACHLHPPDGRAVLVPFVSPVARCGGGRCGGLRFQLLSRQLGNPLRVELPCLHTPTPDPPPAADTSISPAQSPTTLVTPARPGEGFTCAGRELANTD